VTITNAVQNQTSTQQEDSNVNEDNITCSCKPLYFCVHQIFAICV